MTTPDDKPTKDGMSGKREPMNAWCRACGHKWTPCYLPMPISKWVKLVKGLHCPMCAGDGKTIYIDAT